MERYALHSKRKSYNDIHYDEAILIVNDLRS